MTEGTGQITIAYFDMNDSSDYSHFVSGLTRTNKYKVVDGMEVYEGWEYRDSDAPRASDTRRIALWYEGASVGLAITAEYMKTENLSVESAIREAEVEAQSQDEAIEYIIPTVVPVFTSNLEQLIPNDGVDVVGNQRVLAVVHRHAPLLFAIEGDEVRQELRNILIGGRKEGVGAFLALNLCLALQCLLVGSAGFPFLLGLAVLVHIGVDDGIVFLSFDNGCHNESSFLVSQVK